MVEGACYHIPTRGFRLNVSSPALLTCDVSSTALVTPHFSPGLRALETESEMGVLAQVTYGPQADAQGSSGA